MTILYLLIPIAMLFALVAGLAFFLTIRGGQYDDLDGAAHRILMDDDDPRIPGRSKHAVGERPSSDDDDPDAAGANGDRPESSDRKHDSRPD